MSIIAYPVERFWARRLGRLTSNVEELSVKPDVLLTGSNQEPPARAQAEVLQYLWIVIRHMEHVQGTKEICIGEKLFTGPNIPTCCIVRGRMSKTVDRKLACIEGPADAYFVTVISGDKRSPKS
jgi:hypothetical protein